MMLPSDIESHIREHRNLSRELLEKVVQAASSNIAEIYEPATELLSNFVAWDPQALNAVTRMSKSASAKIRFNSVLCLSSEIAEDRLTEILTRLLHDRSIKVREKAVDWIGRLSLVQFIDELQRIETLEINEKIIDVIRTERLILKYGYEVVPSNAPSKYIIKVKTPKGRVVRVINMPPGQDYSAEDIWKEFKQQSMRL